MKFESLLTNQQSLLLSIAREKGFVMLGEAKLVYASPGARKAALMRLCNLGFLRVSTRPNRFDLVVKE